MQNSIYLISLSFILLVPTFVCAADKTELLKQLNDSLSESPVTLTLKVLKVDKVVTGVGELSSKVFNPVSYILGFSDQQEKETIVVTEQNSTFYRYSNLYVQELDFVKLNSMHSFSKFRLSIESLSDPFFNNFVNTYDLALTVMGHFLAQDPSAAKRVIQILAARTDQFKQLPAKSYTLSGEVKEHDKQTGEAAWVLNALCKAWVLTKNPIYLNYAENLSKAMTQQLLIKEGQFAGLFKGNLKQDWISCEHQISAMAALRLYSDILEKNNRIQEAKEYRQIAQNISDWFRGNGSIQARSPYYPQTGSVTRGAKDKAYASDVALWLLMADGNRYNNAEKNKMIDYVIAQSHLSKKLNSVEVQGISFSNEKDVISFEWTQFLIQVLRVQGRSLEAAKYADSIDEAFSDGKLWQASERGISFRGGWKVYSDPALASQIWMLFSRIGFNPLTENFEK